MLLDALDGVMISDAERASLEWLAGSPGRGRDVTESGVEPRSAAASNSEVGATESPATMAARAEPSDEQPWS